MLIVSACVSIILLAVFCVIRLRKLVKRENERRAAAEVLFRYRGLDSILFNDSSENPWQQRIYVCISYRDERKEECVFDPETVISIGYEPEANQLAILDKSVSGRHCQIYSENGCVFVRDLQSENGTWIKRGLSKARVQGAAEIFDGDSLLIGPAMLRIFLRVYHP